MSRKTSPKRLPTLPQDIILNEIIPLLDQDTLRSMRVSNKNIAEKSKKHLKYLFYVKYVYDPDQTSGNINTYFMVVKAKNKKEALKNFIFQVANDKDVQSFDSIFFIIRNNGIKTPTIVEMGTLLDSSPSIQRDFLIRHADDLVKYLEINKRRPTFEIGKFDFNKIH